MTILSFLFKTIAWLIILYWQIIIRFTHAYLTETQMLINYWHLAVLSLLLYGLGIFFRRSSNEY